MNKAGFVTGGVAGLSLLIFYLTGWPVGALMPVLTIPFLVLTVRTMGYAFALKTLLVSVALFVMISVAPHAFQISSIRSRIVCCNASKGNWLENSILNLADMDGARLEIFRHRPRTRSTLYVPHVGRAIP